MEQTHLGDESYEFPEVLCVFVRIDEKNLSNTIVVVPLLEKLFFVGCWVSLDEILELREV